VGKGERLCEWFAPQVSDKCFNSLWQSRAARTAYLLTIAHVLGHLEEQGITEGELLGSQLVKRVLHRIGRRAAQTQCLDVAAFGEVCKLWAIGISRAAAGWRLVGGSSKSLHGCKVPNLEPRPSSHALLPLPLTSANHHPQPQLTLNRIWTFIQVLEASCTYASPS
jgi:hypothetical protein